MPQSGLARRSNYVVLAESVGEDGCDDGGVIAEHAAAPGTQHQLAVPVCSRDLGRYLFNPLTAWPLLRLPDGRLLAPVITNALGDLLVGVSMFTGAIWESALHWTLARAAFLAGALIGACIGMPACAGTQALAADNKPRRAHLSATCPGAPQSLRR